MADNYYNFDASKGIITTDTGTILDAVNSEIQAVFGNDIDLSPETPQGRIAELLTVERSSVVGFNAAQANQLNLDYATGLYLDAIGSLFRVSREGASRSRVFATLTGTAGTVIPAGSKAKSGLNEFYAENDITLPTVGAYFLSSETGAIPCDAGTLTKIVASVLGWTGITNSSEPSPYGAPQESDVAYRSRIKASRYSGTGFVDDMTSAVRAVDNIKSSFVKDNGTASEITYDTIPISAHSVIIIADGGEDADIAQAIYENKSGGCAYTKIQGVSVITFTGTGNDGEIVTISGVDYRLKTTMSQAFDVQIGADANATATSLSHAINLTGTVGVDYYDGTTINLFASSEITDTAEATITGGKYGVVLASTDSTDASVSITKDPQAVYAYVQDGLNDVTYTINFNRPSDISIKIEITVKAGGASETEVEAAVKAAIIDWAAGEVDGVDGLSIGQNVSPFEVAAAVSDQLPALYVKKCQVAKLADSFSTDEIEIRTSEIARIDAGDIEVIFV